MIPENRGLFLRLLLNRAHGNISPSLLKTLPEEDKNAVLNCPVQSKDPLPLLLQETKSLTRYHYSWLAEILKEVPAKQRTALIGCLEKGQREGLAKLEGGAPIPVIKSPLLRKFYLNHFYPLLKVDGVLPLEYLPETFFNTFFLLKKNEILEIIDLLGIYDLAQEMKQIVATKHLKNIYAALGNKNLPFLKRIFQVRDKIPRTPLNLEKWDGTPRSLLTLLHKRGLDRLAIAMSGQHADLIWHLSRMLDKGRGEFLQARVKKEPLPNHTTTAIAQVESALNYIKEQKS